MTTTYGRIYQLALAGALITFGACSGGGGGGSSPVPGGGGGTPTPTPTPAPTATPVATTVTGTLVDYTSGSPIAGATVTIGALPNASTCNNAQTATLNVCGTVSGPPTWTGTTSSTGTWEVLIPQTAGTGNFMIAISNGTGYATLHAQIAVAAGANALGTFKITALSSDEQAWVADVNNQRTTVSYPVSFGNLTVDEYAEELEREYAAAVVAGTIPFSDAGEETYDAMYGTEPGAIYGASSVAALQPSASAYLAADNAWMAEKANCPNGNWQTCTFADNTGHYINISNTTDVWVGLGESSSSYYNTTYNATYWAYGIMIVMNVNGPAPAGFRRATAEPIHRR